MRRLLKILGCLAALALIAVLVLPWWLAPVLHGVAAHYGASFASYERLGYSRFALHHLTYERANVRVTVERAESATPVLWLFKRLSGKPDHLVGTTWRVEVMPTTATTATAAAATAALTTATASTKNPAPATAVVVSTPGPPMSAMRLRTILDKVVAVLERWLPQTAIGAGKVTWPDGGLQLTAGTWDRRSLSVRGLHLFGLESEVRIAETADGVFELQAKSATQEWQATLKNSRDQISGEVRLWDQPATVQARFANDGWMPAEMELRADNWSVSGTKAKLGQFYSTVHGAARVDWRDGKFETSADVTSVAIPDRKAPPLAAKLRGHGTGESLTIDSLAVEIPGVSAGLTAPAVFDRHGKMAGEASRFSLTADLEKQPWLKAKGKIAGEAQLKPRDGKAPLIEATLNAQDVALPDWAIARFAATAQLDWPQLEVKRAEVGFAEGGQLALSGKWDFETKEIHDATAEGMVRPSLVARWLPASVGFESVTISAKASGPFAALAHEGKAHVNALTVTNLQPLAADVAWSGKAAEIKITEARVQAGASQIVLAGTVEATGAQLTALKISQGDAERLTLKNPATVHWSPKIEIGPLELTGGEASVVLTATAGESGHANISARNFSSTWLTDFVSVAGPEWRVVSLAAEGNWDRGPLTFKAESELAVTLDAQRTAAVTLKAHGDKDGVQIESLHVAEGAAPIVNATGRLPLTLHPGASPLVHMEESAALTLHATTTSNPAFWKKLAETTGLEFEEPEATVELSGTWAKPQGVVHAKATRLAADEQRYHLPVSSVEALDLQVTADRAGLTVEQFSAKVEGQAVRATGKIAFTPEQWPEVKKDPVAFLRARGNAHVEMPDAEFAAVARRFPGFLAQSGRVQVDATFAPGGEMKGTLQLRDAATRPVGTLGVLQEISGEAQLVGNSIEVRSLAGRLGGQPVTLSGKIELPVKAAAKYNFTLKGENLPLMRQTGLLVRADVDLKLATADNNVPTISGAVTLRDSVFLSDLRAFIPRARGGAPARHPPYFAVETAPLSTWRLNVDVRGEKFLRLRSTLFTGTASARFNLGGTLGDPNLRGVATVDSGMVTLPFAAFKIEEGTVKVTDEDPNALRLAVTGTSRRYGYDLRMEVSGTADAPVVIFNSTPALDAKQVLLMVTAGELPHDEITYGTAQRAARLGTYLGQSLISSFGGDAADADRLSITTGERVSSLGRETYDVEYRLSDRFTVVGEYDEYDAYNTGVKWSVRPPENPEAKKNESPLAVEKETTHEQPH